MSNILKFLDFIGYVLDTSPGFARMHPDATGVSPSFVGEEKGGHRKGDCALLRLRLGQSTWWKERAVRKFLKLLSQDIFGRP